MDNQMPPDRSNTLQTNHHHPSPISVPRSQFANTRSSAVRTSTNNTTPRYFSAPFRAPPSRPECHDSLTEHQISPVETNHTGRSTPQTHQPQRHERTSYAMFEPQATNGPLNNSKKFAPTSRTNHSGDSPSHLSKDQHGIVRQASIGHKAKPALLEVRRPDSSQTNRLYPDPKTPPPKAGTIEALNIAIAAASKELAKDSTHPPMSRHASNQRAPYDSPTSTYSQEFSQHRKSQYQAASATLDSGRVSPLEEESQSSIYYDPEPLSPLPKATPHSEKSASSTNPLLGLGIEQSSASSRVPEHMRPPRLNMKAVEDVDSRGSITSLPDLIRRATRLASNLDRGKTASRLGLLDFFGNADLSNGRNRESTFSDVLNAFPDPASGTQGRQPRASTIWPGESKEAVVTMEEQEPTSSKRKKAPRRCCGMSITVFIVIILIVVLLIAAAALIPIFLVVVPREYHDSVNLRNCAASRPCSNNGVSIIDNNACSCICVDGFTGNDCSRPPGAYCVTANIMDGSRTYYNATIGSSLLSLMSQAQSKMSIPLNNTALLSVFATNNLSCASENSLVELDTNSRRNNPRFIIVHGINAIDGHIPYRPVPVKASPVSSTTTAAALVVRQTGVQTANDIVYQTTNVRDGSSIASTTATAASVATGSTTVSSSSPSPTTQSNLTPDQLEFAQIVVLFVLADSHVPSTAVTAQQNIEQYLRAGGPTSGNSTVNLGQVGKTDLVANFAQLTITRTDGFVIAGNSTRS